MDREDENCIDKNVVHITCDFIKCSNPFKQRENENSIKIPKQFLPRSPRKCVLPAECSGLTDDEIRKLVKQKADSKVQEMFERSILYYNISG